MAKGFTLGFRAMPRRDRSGHFPERLVKQGLVSLVVAARMVHRRAYPQQYAIAEPSLSERQLDALAHVIATLAAIYTVNYRSARFRQPDGLCAAPVACSRGNAWLSSLRDRRAHRQPSSRLPPGACTANVSIRTR